MKKIHIFRTGTHTSAGGTTLDFGEAVLQAAVDAYDPAIHEAPIVVGHPKDNGPAFGWVKGLEYREGNVYADPHQVNVDFEEQVKAGAYKKVSASFYSPEAAANPVPGSYYLRHVGFLGAQPPALKGLGAVEFAEVEEGDVIEFSGEWETAGIFRRLREFLIDKFTREEADQVIPAYMVESLEDNLRMPSEEPQQSYTEEGSDMPMTPEEIAAAEAKIQADRAALEAEQSSFAEQRTQFEAARKAARKAEIAEQVDALVADGKVLPAFAAGLKDFAEKCDAEQVVEFGEGDDKQSKPAPEFLFAMLSAGSVDYQERSRDDGARDKSMTAEELSAKALEYREEQRKKGSTISVTAAVNHIQSQG